MKNDRPDRGLGGRIEMPRLRLLCVAGFAILGSLAAFPFLMISNSEFFKFDDWRLIAYFESLPYMFNPTPDPVEYDRYLKRWGLRAMPAEDPRIDIIWYSQWRWGLHHTSAGEAYIGIVVGAFLGWLAGIGLYRVFNQGLYRFLWPQAHRTIEHVAWRIPLVATIAAMVALAGWYGSIMLYYSRFPPGIWPEAPIWIDERGIASAGRSGLPSWVDPQNPAFKHLWNFESLWQDASRRASPKIVFSGIIIAGLIGWMVGAVAFQCIRWIGWSRRPAT